MEALDNLLMAPNTILGADDEMMDSDFDHAIPQDDDYDIELDGGDAYSNMGMDEEMKFDTVDDAVTYDNDDLMLDEADYQTTTELQGEEIVLLDMQQPGDTNVVSYEAEVVYESKEVEFTEIEAEAPAPIASSETLDQLSPSVLTTTDMTAEDPTVSAPHQTEEVATEQVTAPETMRPPVAQEFDAQEASNRKASEVTQSPSEHGPVNEADTVVDSNSIEDDAEVPADVVDASDEHHESTSLGTHGVPSPQVAAVKIHPIVVQFDTNTLALFNSEHYIDYRTSTVADGSTDQDASPSGVYPEIPSMYLLNDPTMVEKGFDEIFAALREMFADEIGEDAELTMEIDELELFMHEDNLLTKSVSLSDLIDLHLRLCTQDGIERPQPMYITLATQPRFTKRYSELLSAAGEGKGLSQVRTYSSVDEYQPSVHDNQSQAVQGSPDASGYSPDNNQASVQSDYRADEGEFDQQAEEQHLEVKTTLEEVSTVVLEAETKDDFIVIENGTQNGNKEDRAPEFDLTDAHSERATVQSSPSHEEDEADVVASLTEEQYEVLPTKITIEEVADDNVDDTQLPEEVYEPEGSVLTESRSVTEVTTETVQDEEELLEYEEEDETGYVVRSEGSPQQEPESESTLHESHVPSPGSTSNEAEGTVNVTDAPLDDATAEDALQASDHDQYSNATVQSVSGSPTGLDDEIAPPSDVPQTDAEEPHHIQAHQFEDGTGNTGDASGEGDSEAISAHSIPEERVDESRDGEDKQGSKEGNLDLEAVNLNEAQGSNYHGWGDDDYQSPRVEQEEGEDDKYGLFMPDSKLIITDPSYYMYPDQTYQPGDPEWDETHARNIEEQWNETEDPNHEEQWDLAEEQNEGFEHYEVQGEYDVYYDNVDASEEPYGSTEYLQEAKPSSINETSPSGKRLRENDEVDSLDVQHIKRTRSQ